MRLHPGAFLFDYGLQTTPPVTITSPWSQQIASSPPGGDDPAAVYRQHRFIVTTPFLNYAAGTVSFGVRGQPLRVINRHTVPPARTVRLNAPSVTAHTCASSSRAPSYLSLIHIYRQTKLSERPLRVFTGGGVRHGKLPLRAPQLDAFFSAERMIR